LLHQCFQQAPNGEELQLSKNQNDAQGETEEGESELNQVEHFG